MFARLFARRCFNRSCKMYAWVHNVKLQTLSKVVRRRLRKAWGDRGGRYDENSELEPEDLVLNRR